MSTPVIATCRLCQKSKRLHNSHIIPNSFFKRLKTNGRAIVFKTDYRGSREHSQETWQEYLLCYDCEQIFQRYEWYVSQLLYYPRRINVVVKNTKSTRGFIGIDYQQLKQFQLSILWRASIAYHKCYEWVQLKPEQLEELRVILCYKKYCPPGKYWCEMSTYYDDENKLQESTQFICNPTCQLIKDELRFIFIFGGYIWTFHVSEKTLQPRIINSLKKGKLFITKQNMWEIPVLNDPIMTAAEKGLFTGSFKK